MTQPLVYTFKTRHFFIASGNTQSGGGGGSYAPSSAAAVSSEPVEPVDTQETQSAPATANASVVLGPAFPKLTNPREPSRGQPIQLSQLKSSAENSPSGSRRSSSGPDNVGSAGVLTAREQKTNSL